ncbi:MAG: DUF362 domain-containing protein [Candidatus Zhuqueibacterota bacterium]
MKRRTFLQRTVQTLGALSLGFLRDFPASAKNRPVVGTAGVSTVVIARRDSVRDAGGWLIPAQVSALLDVAMKRYFQVSDSEQAWQKVVSKKDVVGIKVNCLAGRGISSSPELVDAIIAGLQRAGVPGRNIIIWDRSNRDLEKAGFAIRPNGDGVRCFGSDLAGYSDEVFEFGEVGSCISNIVLRYCSAIINVPVMKDHGIVGVTNAMKNFFGAIHNPNKYHDNRGDPFIADVNMLPAIRSKTRITITDALTAQYEGGPPFMPQWAWPFNGLLVGRDMVALDSVAWDIIEKKRREKGMSSLKEAGREPTYIATAADARHRLGVNDLNAIQIVQV